MPRIGMAAAVATALVLVGAAVWCYPEWDGRNVMAQARETSPARAFQCLLTDSELRERRETVFNTLGERARNVHLTGVRLSAEYTADDVARVVEFIELERQCCPFFTFTLTFAPGNGPVELTVEAPEGAAALVSALAQPWLDGEGTGAAP